MASLSCIHKHHGQAVKPSSNDWNCIHEHHGPAVKSSANDSNERYRCIIGNGSIMINNKKVTFNDEKATEVSRAERIRFGSVDFDSNPMMPHRVSMSNRYGPLSYEDDNDEIQMSVLD